MTVKLILWDLDGLMVDSLNISMQNFIDSVKPSLKKSELPTKREIYDSYLGATEEDDVIKLAELKGITSKRDVQKRFVEIKQKNLEKIKFFRGIQEIILYAKSKGLKQALATGRDKKAANKIVKNKFNKIRGKTAFDYFDYVIAGDEYRGKENAFSTIKKKFKVKGMEILVLGDEVKDMKVAQKLGFISGACFWGTFVPKELKATKPEISFKKPSEILAWLKKNTKS